MKDKIQFNFIYLVIAFPLGLALKKHFDYNTFTLQQPALDTLYLIVFIACIFLAFRKKKKTDDPQTK